MQYLMLDEVLALHRRVLTRSGGSPGVRDQGALESALAQPHMGFGGVELYPTLVDQAAAIGFSLILNHPFVDGNKRIGHAVLESFLLLNGHEISATTEEQERVILDVAAGQMGRAEFAEWLRSRVIECRTA